jgi:hypothetical protein
MGEKLIREWRVRSWERGTGSWERGTGSWERGIGNFYPKFYNFLLPWQGKPSIVDNFL